SIDAPPTVSAGRHVGPEPAQRASFSRHGVLIMRLESTFITRGVFLLGLEVAMLTAGCAEDGTTVEESTSAVIGSDGGSLQGPGVDLEVPTGALPAATEIGIEALDRLAPENHTALSPVFRFSPAGTVFETPVTVRFALDSVPADGDVVIYWTTEGGDTFMPLPTTVEGNVAIAQVSHFSMGFAGHGPAGCVADSDCTANEVCMAGLCTRTSVCGAGQTDCAGACVDLATD